MDARQELVIERVLRCAELVPRGQVASYGLIGAICSVGPRQVGAIMSRYGSGIAWWRITNAAGELPTELRARAVEHWRAEGVAVRADGRGCAYRAHVVDRDELAEAWRASLAELPQLPALPPIPALPALPALPASGPNTP